MDACDASQALGRVVDAGERRASFANRLLHRPVEHGEEDIVLAPKVQIDRACRDAGAPGDVGDLRSEEPAFGEDAGGGVENLLALVRKCGSRLGGSSTTGHSSE
jgi:hypothetical protein